MTNKLKAALGLGIASICLILYLAEKKLDELIEEMFDDDLDWTP